MRNPPDYWMKRAPRTRGGNTTVAKTKKKTTKKKTKTAKKSGKNNAPARRRLSPKANAATKKAAEALWGVGVAPHDLLQEVRDLLLLRCLEEADGNYAAAAEAFGPSRQSVQQYANSPLRDSRWKRFQQKTR